MISILAFFLQKIAPGKFSTLWFRSAINICVVFIYVLYAGHYQSA